MNKKTDARRLIIVCLFFIMLFALLFWRVLVLMVFDRPFLQGQGNARSLRVIDIPAFRGMILDRNGAPLAISTPVQSLWINPKQFHPSRTQLKQLARLLNVSVDALSSYVQSVNQRGFVYLKRQLPPHISEKIDELHIPGLNFLQEFKRYYPDAESTAQLLGFTNIDDHGIEGLELAYDQWLYGQPGKRKVLKDRSGHVIDDLGVIQEPKAGKDLSLSIDRRIQFFAYHELKDALLKYQAKSGSIVVLDVKTSEVLAIANLPSFNPNIRNHYQQTNYRNKAITDTFEPGSVMKPFSVASALESGLYTPDSIIDTNPSWMVVHEKTIRDVHNYGVLTVQGVLQHSSNVGVSKMVLSSPPEQLMSLLLRCGVGSKTESGYPGESDGFMVNIKQVNPFVLATLSFGYGMSVTTLQLVKMYSIFAHHGKLYPIRLLHYDDPLKGEQVLKPEISDQVLKMLEFVVHEGTGVSAQVPGYRVAGKTGTARIAGKNGYSERRYIASFVGIAPVSDPRLVVAVIVFEPSLSSYYAAQVAAPLFSKVMGTALRVLDIPPDQPTASSGE